MKKLIYGGLFLALVGITVYSCKKEEINAITEKDSSIKERIKTDGKILIFETLKDYETLISLETPKNQKDELFKHIQNLKFENYLSKNKGNIQQKSGENEIQEMDEELGQLLNHDGVIQIENNLYKVNLENEKVFSLPAPLYGMHYQTLVDELTDGTPVKKHSIDDDVLYTKSGGCGGIGAGTYPCYPSVAQGQIVATLGDGSVWRLNPGVKFFKGGIYFRLSSLYEIWAFSSSTSTSGTKVNNLNGLFTVEIFCRGPQGWYKKRPCGSKDIGTQASGLYYSKTVGAHQQTFYSGTRNLNGYYFFVQGRVRYPDGSVTIASPYGGRNINSPY